MKTLAIVSPVFEEAALIAEFYQELKVQLENLTHYQTTIIFVVDPGRDKTLAILKDIARRDSTVRILSMSARFGHQACLLAGIDHADAEVIIMMDSDLQHPPALIPELLKEFEQGGVEIVNAVRRKTESVGVFKKISSRLFYWFIKHISTTRLPENAPDFRLISGRVARLIKEQLRERNLFLRGLIGWLGFRQKFVEFVAPPRSAGASKYSISRLMGLGLSGTVSFSRKPLRAIFLSGVIGLGIFFILALLMLVKFLVLAVVPSALAIILMLVFFLFNIQSLFLGVIGEYLGAIFEEVKGRPHYIIDEKINF